jgi:hypothetical protein
MLYITPSFANQAAVVAVLFKTSRENRGETMVPVGLQLGDPLSILRNLSQEEDAMWVLISVKSAVSFLCPFPGNPSI